MEPKKNWFRRHIYLTAFLIIFGIPIIIGTLSSATTNTSSINYQEESKPVPIKEKVVFPVEIVSSKIVDDSIGTPNLYITVKNTSNKTIDALEVDAYLFDNFDEPAGEFGRGSNLIIGTYQEKIAPGASYTGQWNLAVYEMATKVKDLKVRRVHFTDGTLLADE
jgi:hypothetical protein